MEKRSVVTTIWKSERCRLNSSPDPCATGNHAHTPTAPRPSPIPNIIPNVFYLSAPLAIFFLIRRLPASGVFIIYRKLITYTGLQGSHPAHGLLLQKRFHARGPWASRWRLLISNQSWQTWSLQSARTSPRTLASRYFSSAAPLSYICRVKHPPASLEGSQTVWLQRSSYVSSRLILLWWRRMWFYTVFDGCSFLRARRLSLHTKGRLVSMATLPGSTIHQTNIQQRTHFTSLNTHV